MKAFMSSTKCFPFAHRKVSLFPHIKSSIIYFESLSSTKLFVTNFITNLNFEKEARLLYLYEQRFLNLYEEAK
jgi:hypothetical protein